MDGYQLQKNLTQLPIAPDQQLKLAQELVCLLTYIGELFNVDGIVVSQSCQIAAKAIVSE